MKALILAAGLGTRLEPITNNIPKCLVSINGKPIIFKQIENLIVNGITDILVVAGYKADILKKNIQDNYPIVKVIENVDYATTNNMYSAYIAREYMLDSQFIMMNADVYFDASILKSLLEYEAKNAIVTDVGEYNSESMKVAENNNRLVAISKDILPGQALGVSIDVYKFSKEAGRAFFDKCVEYIESANMRNLWSEIALNDILLKSEFRACPFEGRWFEIDNKEDLKEAERIFIEG